MRARGTYTYTYTHTHSGQGSQGGKGSLCKIRGTGRELLWEFYPVNLPCQEGVKTPKVHIYRRKVHIYRRKVHIYRRKQILRSTVYAPHRAAACPKILKVTKYAVLPPLLRWGVAQVKTYKKK